MVPGIPDSPISRRVRNIALLFGDRPDPEAF